MMYQAEVNQRVNLNCYVVVLRRLNHKIVLDV